MSHLRQLPSGYALCDKCALASTGATCPQCGTPLSSPEAPGRSKGGERLPPLPSVKLSTSAKAVKRGRKIGDGVISMGHMMRARDAAKGGAE